MLWTSSTSGSGVTGTAPGPVNQTFPVCTDNEKFVTVQQIPYNWLSPPINTLWNMGSLLDPCPQGYQVPSEEEWESEAVTHRSATPVKYLRNVTCEYFVTR